MAASRAARKREMIANLANEEYLNDLVNESYAIIFTQSMQRVENELSSLPYGSL